jgi:hypothetical protein
VVTALIEDESTIQRIKEIVEFASKPENFWNPQKCNWIPGERPEFVFYSGTMRAVFTISFLEGKKYRHLSVSNKTNLPNPIAVWQLCKSFGFTYDERCADMDGLVCVPDATWEFMQSPIENCVIVLQPIKD